MRVTVLPVRDPERPEKPSPQASWPVREIPGEGPDDAAEASVELLRAPRQMPASSAPRSAVFSPGPPARGGASSSGAASPSGPPSPAPAEPAPPAMMEIMLTNGRVLRVPPGIGRAELEAVLAVASGQESPRPPPPAPPKRRR